MIRLLTAFLLGLFASQPAVAEVVGTPIDYRAGDTVLKGYLAYDDAIKGKRPGVLVVHEWWGHNEYARKRARMLAELGYTALAVDMYGDGKTANHPEDASKMSGELRNNKAATTARFNAALDLLKQRDSVEGSQIAAIGYCMGGGIALEMARRGVDLKGVASFHGSLATDDPAQGGDVKAAVLVLHGADDKFVKPEDIDAFKQEMQNAKVDFQFIAYPGAVHSFTNPDADTFGKQFNLPLAYNKEADEQSWAELQAFFKKIFAGN